jgi:hypothetical protein
MWDNDDRVHGKITYECGDTFEGDFKFDREYNGIFTFVNGDTVIGMSIGKAKYTFKTDPNKQIFEGEFIEGNANGLGKLTYRNGDTQEGTWKDGKANGDAVFFVASENKKYKTHFTNDIEDGKRVPIENEDNKDAPKNASKNAKSGGLNTGIIIIIVLAILAVVGGVIFAN